jgi:hypothetical protein
MLARCASAEWHSTLELRASRKRYLDRHQQERDRIQGGGSVGGGGGQPSASRGGGGGESRLPQERLTALLRQIQQTKRTVEADEEDTRGVQAALGDFLLRAVQHYGAALRLGVAPKHGLRATFRVCALWFDNSDNPAVNAAMAALLGSVNSALFVPLIYQIASRLGPLPAGSQAAAAAAAAAGASSAAPPASFQGVLWQLLLKLGVEHPYHSLVQVRAGS